MPLLLLDLDNTLVDRDAAFRNAAEAFLAAHALPAADLAWVMAVDADGYAPRPHVASVLCDRYPDVAPEAVQALLDHGAADHVVLTRSNRDAIRCATDLGWTPVVVTNGRVRQQETKLRVSGLDRVVAGWVISEAVGCAKPDQAIFAAAAAVAGADLGSGGWMVGDSPHADIGGAVDAGLQSVWIHRGRAWPAELPYRPTYVADEVASALAHITATG